MGLAGAGRERPVGPARMLTSARVRSGRGLWAAARTLFPLREISWSRASKSAGRLEATHRGFSLGQPPHTRHRAPGIRHLGH